MSKGEWCVSARGRSGTSPYLVSTSNDQFEMQLFEVDTKYGEVPDRLQGGPRLILRVAKAFVRAKNSISARAPQ